jgi:hypothetical protein
MNLTASINPFFAARVRRQASQQPDTQKPVYARLPLAPKNASPVPHLTSLYHFDSSTAYGKRAYAGNCGGDLIRDLLTYFRPGLLIDPMSGSGTCADVCETLGIPCMSFDIHQGFDACDPKDFCHVDMFDFVWAHPAYWRMKLYANDPRDLSRSPTLEHFLNRYRQFIRNCVRALKPQGKLAILMGDICDHEAGFVSLTYHTKRLAAEAGLRQCCTDIIRFGHGASSSRKVYRTSFIPILHDTCMVFERR